MNSSVSYEGLPMADTALSQPGNEYDPQKAAGDFKAAVDGLADVLPEVAAQRDAIISAGTEILEHHNTTPIEFNVTHALFFASIAQRYRRTLAERGLFSPQSGEQKIAFLRDATAMLSDKEEPMSAEEIAGLSAMTDTARTERLKDYASDQDIFRQVRNRMRLSPDEVRPYDIRVIGGDEVPTDGVAFTMTVGDLPTILVPDVNVSLIMNAGPGSARYQTLPHEWAHAQGSLITPGAYGRWPEEVRAEVASGTTAYTELVEVLEDLGTTCGHKTLEVVDKHIQGRNPGEFWTDLAAQIGLRATLEVAIAADARTTQYDKFSRPHAAAANDYLDSIYSVAGSLYRARNGRHPDLR